MRKIIAVDINDKKECELFVNNLETRELIRLIFHIGNELKRRGDRGSRKLSQGCLFEDLEGLIVENKRLLRTLKAEGFEYIGDIVCNPKLRGHGEDFYELRKIDNLGDKSYKELLKLLRSRGIMGYIESQGYQAKREEKFEERFEHRDWGF
jgi:hypothetical protein